MWTKEEEAALDLPELSSRDLSDKEFRSYLVDEDLRELKRAKLMEAIQEMKELKEEGKKVKGGTVKKRVVKPKKNSAKKKMRGDDIPEENDDGVEFDEK